MPTRTEPWPAGSPCWADNHVPDLAEARDFYGAIFGWQIDDPDPAAGNFAAARLDGRQVAGFLVAVEGARPEWHVFIASGDIDATAAAIVRHGGSKVFGPQAVPVDRGSFYLATDPCGAVFGTWQAGSLAGTGVFGEHGSLHCQELRSSDPGAERTFYREVFGVEAGPSIGGDGDQLLGAPAEPAGPALGMRGLAGPEDATRWLVGFAVDDVDAAIAACRSHGGAVLSASGDGPHGPAATLADPFGAVFQVTTLDGKRKG